MPTAVPFSERMELPAPRRMLFKPDDARIGYDRALSGDCSTLSSWVRHTSHKQLMGEPTMSSYIYTNWRGKQFVIDEVFADEMKQSLLADGCDAEFVATVTPESIMKDLPLHEKIERLQQLNHMWEGSVNPQGR